MMMSELHDHLTDSQNERLKPRNVKSLAQGHLVCSRLSLAWVPNSELNYLFTVPRHSPSQPSALIFMGISARKLLGMQGIGN